jgi:hypothetical protein
MSAFAGFAAVVTHVAASQTDQQIESGGTIRVYAVVASAGAGGAGTVTIEDAGTTTVKLIMNVAASSTATLEFPFIADKGIQVTTSNANVTCTVLHSHAGV